MKRFMLIAFLLCALNSVKGQKMDLLHSGFVSASDTSKVYIVLEFPKFKQIELFKKTLTYLNSIYKNPAAVISTVDGESITVNGFDNSISLTGDLYKYPFSYNIVIRFKDGKLRFEPRITEIHEIFRADNVPNRYYVANTDSPNKVEVRTIYFFSKENGKYKLLNEEMKLKMDSWVNNYITSLKNSINADW